MFPEPTLVATSVVRGSQQGDSHGGIYLIDFAREIVVQTVDWNSSDIDFQGRGWDRGLRGIEVDGDDVYIAASDELFVYGPDFVQRGAYRNPYLRHAHEIGRYGRNLFVTSTGFDAVLAFDLDKKIFTWGLGIQAAGDGVRGVPFDPARPDGPPPRNRFHINNVFCDDSGMYLSGRGTRALLRFDGKRLHHFARLPFGVHNARPFRNGILYNDTEEDSLRLDTSEELLAFRVPDYDPAELTHTDLDDSAIARQGFGRGLCVVSDAVVAAGSSPSTICMYDLGQRKTGKIVNISLDIRNAIHGLAVWPFATA